MFSLHWECRCRLIFRKLQLWAAKAQAKAASSKILLAGKGLLLPVVTVTFREGHNLVDYSLIKGNKGTFNE